VEVRQRARAESGHQDQREDDQADRKVTLMSTAGNDQIVVRRPITPTLASRKCPGVASAAPRRDSPELPHRPGRRHGGQQERKSMDAPALGRRGEVDGDDRVSASPRPQ